MLAKPVFTLRATHSHKGALLPTISESAATAAVLSGLGMGIKRWGEVLLVYAETDASGMNRTKLSSKIVLSFLINKIDSAFMALTDFSQFKDLSAPLFSNTQDSLTLKLSDQTLVGNEQTIAHREGPQRLPLTGRPAPNTQAAEITAKSSTGIIEVQGYNRLANTIDVTGSGLKKGIAIKISYPIEKRRPIGAMAEIAVTLDQRNIETWLREGVRDFVIPFAARQIRWCWYIAIPSAIPANAVAITLPSESSQLRGLAIAGAPTDLTEKPDEADPQAKILAARLTGRRLLRFLSAGPVMLDAAAISGIALKIEEKTFIRHLPNPAPEAFGQIGPAGRRFEILHSTVIV
jgi:hypothetical protein